MEEIKRHLKGHQILKDMSARMKKKWWAVINKFAQDIKWHPRHDEFTCSGTAAAAQGCIDGYEAAVKKVEAFLKEREPKKVQMFIKDHIGK